MSLRSAERGLFHGDPTRRTQASSLEWRDPLIVEKLAARAEMRLMTYVIGAPRGSTGRGLSFPTLRTFGHGAARQLRPAASRISAAISSGWEISERWLDFTSMVLASMRFAMKRSRSGLIVRSSVETA